MPAGVWCMPVKSKKAVLAATVTFMLKRPAAH